MSYTARPVDPRTGAPIVLMGDDRVARMPVRECGEPLVDCREAVRVDGRRGDAAGEWARLRAGVLELLVRAEALLPRDRRWLLVEGYRPLALQHRIGDGYLAALRERRPRAGERELRTLASRWVAPAETAGHVAGAAADLTLCTASGAEVDLGCPEAATPEESAGACFTAARGIGAAAAAERRAMAEALGSVGMVNYPTEWWHWSFGDRYWAWSTGAEAAGYGPLPQGG
ncbi:M15 family metallopeptidase [Streptomyces xiaopingdaonensis]|uniref:M15 family metallopeptidase n=1 Tax=Streptomyces xiaopingdaonensis TaxID=1565415 RepID=UPI0002FFB9B2|nr:M15 family metallopeptidase [Streptomyces xiaopingdaonensis]